MDAAARIAELEKTVRENLPEHTITGGTLATWDKDNSNDITYRTQWKHRPNCRRCRIDTLLGEESVIPADTDVTERRPAPTDGSW